MEGNGSLIGEIGLYALILALVFALVQGTLPMVGAHHGVGSWIAVARPAALGQFIFITLAFSMLMLGYVVSDFSIENVALNSHTDKPMLYKISGVWGNHEGSLILWIFILALFGLSVALFGSNLPPTLRARVLAVQGLISFGFLLFTITTSNPFTLLNPPPLQGLGLNPLLQDPGLAFHPPFLYLGYVGFSMAFSFAIAALIEGRVEPAWARWVRPWTLAAWCSLTVGIALGSWWAYYELGWGGWWFWDPVENASFMPWLAGTALLHSAIVVEKRDALKSWTVLLAILTFSLSLLGAFLVRSGVLTSVHAFATDPQRGVFILALLVVVIGGSLTLYAWRAPALKSGGFFSPLSREGGLILNNLLLITACATVLIGTLYPLFLDVITGGESKVSVGPPYFTNTFIPIMLPLVVAVAIGPMLSWKRADLYGALSRLRLALAVALLVVIIGWYAIESGSFLSLCGLSLAAWLFVGTLVDLGERLKIGRVGLGAVWRRVIAQPRATYGMTAAHMGLALTIFGIVASTSWETERLQVMRPGQTADIAGYALLFVGVKDFSGPNYNSVRATFEVSREGAHIATLNPEVRTFTDPPMQTTEAAIRPTITADLYAVVGDPDGQGGWATRIYHKPFVHWIWFGAAVMAGGGLISLSDKRLRVGAPGRRKFNRRRAKVTAS